MPDIQPGTYNARIENILPATYRNVHERRFDEGYFISFKIEGCGTFSEVVTANPHHMGLLARVAGPLMKDFGFPLDSFYAVRDKLIGQTVGLIVKQERGGMKFQFNGKKKK